MTRVRKEMLEQRRQEEEKKARLDQKKNKITWVSQHVHVFVFFFFFAFARQSLLI
jgi:hypothetical protein